MRVKFQKLVFKISEKLRLNYILIDIKVKGEG